MGRKSIRHIKIEEIRQLAAQGFTPKQIAAKVSICYNTVIKYGQGIKKRHGGRKLSDKQIEEITKLRKQGFTLNQVAEKFKVDRSTVSHYCPVKKYEHVTEIAQKETIIFKRPPAVYSNLPSPYRIYNPGATQFYDIR